MSAFVIEAARFHKKNGFNITLICNMSDDFYSHYRDEFNCINIGMNRGSSVLDIFKNTYELYKIFKKQKFDMVQYATPNAAFYASIASYLALVPKRLYCQWGIRYVGFDEGMKRKVFKFIEFVTCSLSTDIRPASEKNRQFSISEKLYKKEKSGVVGKGGTIGVDLGKYNIEMKESHRASFYKNYRINKGDFIFGYVGSLRGDKGTNELIEAFKKISSLYDNVKLVLVGSTFDGDPIQQDLLHWAKSSNKVIFTGRQNNTSLFISSFSVHVHPSYREGFSMVLQEAMALKIPVITTDIPGPSEVVVKDISGLLVAPRDSVQLRIAMETLYLDSEMRSVLSENGFKRCVKYFGREKMLRLTHEDRLKIIAS
ncbi:glycosyltransferase family 4 protein [Shewanella sp. AS1]|uniref:glycosyltransferase family 4 protein n=1 Tax=Shewanella sp. AS1 TaxID=2907626 RepID=UPI001F43C2E9|nr:glycosyltransferase family 4 protein [Shewanella sp. AS1]MCE9679179.1 glycosyltransferase family 4 protein [Shewanella sp. AS1]